MKINGIPTQILENFLSRRLTTAALVLTMTQCDTNGGTSISRQAEEIALASNVSGDALDAEFVVEATSDWWPETMPPVVDIWVTAAYSENSDDQDVEDMDAPSPYDLREPLFKTTITLNDGTEVAALDPDPDLGHIPAEIALDGCQRESGLCTTTFHVHVEALTDIPLESGIEVYASLGTIDGCQSHSVPETWTLSIARVDGP